MTDDESAIRELVATWLAASRSGDLSTVLGLMTDDVLFMVPGREPFGKEAFASASSAMKDVAIEGSSDIQEMVICGEWAWLRNHIEMTVTPPNGAPVYRSGQTLTILRKGPMVAGASRAMPTCSRVPCEPALGSGPPVTVRDTARADATEGEGNDAAATGPGARQLSADDLTSAADIPR